MQLQPFGVRALGVAPGTRKRGPCPTAQRGPECWLSAAPCVRRWAAPLEGYFFFPEFPGAGGAGLLTLEFIEGVRAESSLDPLAPVSVSWVCPNRVPGIGWWSGATGAAAGPAQLPAQSIIPLPFSGKVEVPLAAPGLAEGAPGVPLRSNSAKRASEGSSGSAWKSPVVSLKTRAHHRPDVPPWY
jgi:hypothetical protein